MGEDSCRGVKLTHGRLTLFILTLVDVREKLVETWSRNSERYHNGIILGENSDMG